MQARIAELKETAEGGPANIDAELRKLESKADRLLRDTYAKLTPWQKTQVARHQQRPHFRDYVATQGGSNDMSADVTTGIALRRPRRGVAQFVPELSFKAARRNFSPGVRSAPPRASFG